MLGRWLAVVVMGCSLGACGGGAPLDAPDLVGVWRSQAPDYRDRRLEVQPDWIVFGIGGEATTSFRRDGQEVERGAGKALLYTLFYLDQDGERTQVRLLLEPGPPQKLRFENRPELWLREADAHWLRQRG